MIKNVRAIMSHLPSCPLVFVQIWWQPLFQIFHEVVKIIKSLKGLTKKKTLMYQHSGDSAAAERKASLCSPTVFWSRVSTFVKRPLPLLLFFLSLSGVWWGREGTSTTFKSKIKEEWKGRVQEEVREMEGERTGSRVTIKLSDGEK